MLPRDCTNGLAMHEAYAEQKTMRGTIFIWAAGHSGGMTAAASEPLADR